MRLNSSTKLICSKVVLVPYRITHVEKYNKWMESEKLRKLTASERLSLAEEYEMQQTWLKDEEKCTFIVLNKIKLDASGNEVESMIGDANLYLTKDDEDKLKGEIGLMIAEPQFRGLGYGKEILLCLLNYGAKKLKITEFVAVISLDNVKSIGLFQKFKFDKVGESKVFNEVTLARKVNSEFLQFLDNSLKYYFETTTEENK